MKFGLVIALIKALFHLTLCIVRRLRAKKENSKRSKLGRMASTFFVALVSSLPLILSMNTKEQNLVKLFMFPSVTKLMCNNLLEPWVPTQKSNSNEKNEEF